MSKKILILGYRPGNIADELIEVLDDSVGFHCPSQDVVDVRDCPQIYKWIEKYGPYDAVVYAAAVNNLTWIKDIWAPDLKESYDVNVFGFVLTVANHVRLFPDHPTRFVAVVSDAATTPMRGSLLYGSSKAALSAVIKNMARELAPVQTVVGVSPTVVADTPMSDYIDETVPGFRGWTPEQAASYEASNIPIGRRLTKREVADTLLFAMEGPDGLTGSIIEIRGGK